VKGRITDLTVSIITITGIKGAGVPSGTKWAAMLLNWRKIDHAIEPSQRGRERANVKTRCLDEVKTYGSSPITFEHKINIKKDKKTSVVPGTTKIPKIAPSSFKSALKIRRPLIIIWLGVNQYTCGKTKAILSLESQLNLPPKNKNLDCGSKEEKRLPIRYKKFYEDKQLFGAGALRGEKFS
jgi:hypothetical protein